MRINKNWNIWYDAQTKCKQKVLSTYGQLLSLISINMRGKNFGVSYFAMNLDSCNHRML